MRAPVRLPVIAIAIAAGIAGVEHAGALAMHAGPWLSALAAMVLGGAGRRWPRARWIAGAALVGGAAAAIAYRAPPAIDGVDDREVETLEGVIRGPTTLAGDRIGARLITDDGLRVWLWARPPLRPGDRIAVTGRLRYPRGF